MEYTPEIINNKLIAEFMCYSKYDVQHGIKNSKPNIVDYFNIKEVPLNEDGMDWHSEYDLEFHSSWDWLIPSWVKFNNLGLKHFSCIEIRKEYIMYRNIISQVIIKGDIESTFKLLSQAIEWYNKQSLNK